MKSASRTALREIKDDNVSREDAQSRRVRGKKSSETPEKRLENAELNADAGAEKEKEEHYLGLSPLCNGSGNPDVPNESSPGNSSKHDRRLEASCFDGDACERHTEESTPPVPPPLLSILEDGFRNATPPKPILDPPCLARDGGVNSDKVMQLRESDIRVSHSNAMPLLYDVQGSDSDGYIKTIFENIGFALHSDSMEVNLSDPILNQENTAIIRSQEHVICTPKDESQKETGNTDALTVENEEPKPADCPQGFEQICQPLESLYDKLSSFVKGGPDVTAKVTKRSESVWCHTCEIPLTSAFAIFFI